MIPSELPPSTRRLAAWGEAILAPETYARTVAPALADLAFELAAATSEAERRALRRASRGLVLRVVLGALAHDRKVARRGVAWAWLLAPVVAVVAGTLALPSGAGASVGLQLAFVAVGLGLGAMMASTPRRILAHEAVGAAWLGVLALAVVPFAGVAINGSTRWLAIGPLSIHVATLVLPFIALGLARLHATDRARHAFALSLVWQLVLATTLDLGASLVATSVAVATAALAGPPAHRWRDIACAVGLSAGPLVFAGLGDPGLATSTLGAGALAGGPAGGAALALIGFAIALVLPLALLVREGRDRWTRAVAAAVALTLVIPLVLAPIVGTPLPLIGYGGSAIVATFVGVGALLSLARRAARNPVADG